MASYAQLIVSGAERACAYIPLAGKAWLTDEHKPTGLLPREVET